jgi:large subunit ribosomal protein L10
LERAKKAQVVAELHEKLNRASATVLTDFQGLTVAEMTELRDTLAAQQVEYRVVKNTLMRLAGQETGASILQPLVKGTCAIAIGYDEPTVPAKILKSYIKTNAKLKIKAGALGNRLLSAEQVEALADLPSRAVLLGKLLGTLQAVPTGLVSVLSGVPRAFVGVLAAIQSEMEKVPA